MMQVFVNNLPIEVAPGMKVRHALIRAGIFTEAAKGNKVYDEWNNELGFEGALTEGMRISVDLIPPARKGRKRDISG